MGWPILRTFTRHAEGPNRKLAARPLLPEQPNGAADDPWGINAWIARQPDTEVKPDAMGIPGACLNGWMVVSAAKDIADKAGPITVLAGQLGRHWGAGCATGWRSPTTTCCAPSPTKPSA